MFKLTAEAEYAYLALLQLARKADHGAVVKLNEIIEHTDLSEKFMLQVLGELRRAGLVESKRGKNGGYVLGRNPEQITIDDLLSATLGQSARNNPSFAISGKRSFLARWWGSLLQDVHERGRKTSIADAVEAERTQSELMYHI